jgi:anaerobic sulfite reductase subunit C
MDKLDEVNRAVAPIIRDLEQAIGVEIDNPEKGYPAAGTRNVTACIGNRVCPFANTDTTKLAQRIEALIYPNHYHVKIAVAGCPNDCIKARMQDLGIICMVRPVQERNRCIGCQACVEACQIKVTGAISFDNFQVKRDPDLCIGCGECILSCPALAWYRGEKFFRLLVMGRTGKKDPRMAQTFINWLKEEPLLHIISNTYRYIEKHINKNLAKEHVGYILDRTGYKVFKEDILDKVELNPEAHVAERLEFKGSPYVLH